MPAESDIPVALASVPGAPRRRVLTSRIQIDGEAQGRSIESLRAEAIECDRAADRHRGDYVQNAIRAGECLLEIKRRVGHGNWERWVKDHLPFSMSKVRGYMRLAGLSEANRQRVVDLSLREALKLLARRDTESNPQPRQQTPKLQPPYSTLVDACIQLAGADVMLAYVREKRDPCDLAIQANEFKQAALAVQRRLEQN